MKFTSRQIKKKESKVITVSTKDVEFKSGFDI